jgi:hypothetical protein
MSATFSPTYMPACHPFVNEPLRHHSKSNQYPSSNSKVNEMQDHEMLDAFAMIFAIDTKEKKINH